MKKLYLLFFLISVFSTKAQITATGNSTCENTSTILTASGADNYLWYDVPLGGNYIGIGSPFTTPVLTNNTTYFLQGLKYNPSNFLQTTFVAGNNHRGNMFDISANTDLVISAFDVSPMGNTTIAVYYKKGTYVGFDKNSSAWTLLGTVPVTFNGSPVTVSVDDLYVKSGESFGIYITSTDTNVALNYSNGSNSYNNADLLINLGIGLEYPFGTIYNDRTWNGRIHYKTVVPLLGRQAIDVTVNKAPSLSYAETHVKCIDGNDGAIDLTATGGVAPYTYVWNNGITSTTSQATNLSAGTYEVTVTGANGCIIKQSFTITEPSALNSIPSQIDVLCHGNATGSATAAISGGVAPYTYVWNNGITSTTSQATNLSAGTYEVTVTGANGCIIKQSFTITEPSALNSIPSQIDVLCHGNATGSATAAISGGVAPYTYVWNNGISSTTNEATNLEAGNYEVTVTDANGCIIRQIFTITEPSALNSVPSQVDVLCNGNSTGSATTVISGGVAPYTYVWNNGIISTTNEATNLPTGTYEVTATDANGCIITESFTIIEPSVLNSVPSQVDVLCNGNSTGSATAVISGGVAPYTYVWNNGITSTTNEATNLVADTYEVTVTDANGCIIRQSFTITEPSALNSIPSQIDVLCHGNATGSATATISGGTAPYTYIWNNGITSATNEATNLAAGNYEVTVTDANGCIIKQGFTITEPSVLNSVPSQVDVLCHGESTGSATAVISGGVAPYTYVWNNGVTSTTNEATNLAAGTYEVTVTDANGCIIKQGFTITEPSALNSVPSQVNVLCHGNATGSATAVISGGVAPYTYVWNNGITSTTNEATNLAAGTYEVTVTDANGCIIKQSFTITEPSVLNSVPSQVDVLCHGESTGSATAVISGGVAPYTYVWNNGVTSTTNEATNLTAGTYEVTVTDANGCIIKQSFTITEPTALNSIPSHVDVLCHGESTGSATTVISGGVAPYTYVWNNGITSTTNEATNLAAGTYEVTVTDANGCIIKQSFTITESTALNSAPSQVDLLCNGNATGSATVVISGGVAPYTYVWNSGITSTTNEATNLTAGTYEVTATDANGCIITKFHNYRTNGIKQRTDASECIMSR